ncbi:HET-domain-containing protein [Lentithecium fluviatile CBS 122367]|uniref:HET-domain-containing protein n=1 Tax=Lentithecium fluviatile CBS 122367 TaxID=1168545 RepID=A0A6G1J5X8_9PLEO|nr:HET-domain-containing protein [Lentithecium fluviatile CBS 122367]
MELLRYAARKYVDRRTREQARRAEKLQYPYQPLNHDAGEIRLVELQPGSPGDILEVTLSHSPSSTAPRYIALSYVWGDPTTVTWLRVHENVIPVGKNLADALLHIRDPKKPLNLWIDAICINQSDNDEKSLQVAKMKDIFSRADHVLGWIGTPEGRELLDRSFIENLAARHSCYNHQFNQETSDWIEATLPRENYTHLPQLSHLRRLSPLESIGMLINRPWFSRVWIIQEIVVAKDITIVFGNVRQNFDTFTTAISAIRLYFSHFEKMAINFLAPTSTGHGGDASRRLVTSVKMKFPTEVLFGEGLEKVGLLRREREQWIRKIPTEETTSQSFYDLVHGFANFNATDPRDRIFSLLGIASSDDLVAASLQPNYSMTLDQILRQFTVAHLECTRDLKILNSCYGLDTPPGFSSWAYMATFVTEGSRHNPVTESIVSLKSEVSAGGSFQPNLELGDSNLLLGVHGVRVDSVQIVGAVFDPGAPQGQMAEWGAMVGVKEEEFSLTSVSAEAWTTLRAPEQQYPAGGFILEAFLRTMLMNPSMPIDACGPIKEINSTKYHFGKRSGSIYDRMKNCCVSRRMFITTGGLLGVAPRQAQPGDLVCVFFGGKAPFLLRPGNRHYRLIGDVYVQGLMEGEVVEKGRYNAHDVECFYLS